MSIYAFTTRTFDKTVNNVWKYSHDFPRRSLIFKLSNYFNSWDTNNIPNKPTNYLNKQFSSSFNHQNFAQNSISHANIQIFHFVEKKLHNSLRKKIQRSDFISHQILLLHSLSKTETLSTEEVFSGVKSLPRI